MNYNNEFQGHATVAQFTSSITLKMPLLSLHPYNNISRYDANKRRYQNIIPNTTTNIYNHDCSKITIQLEGSSHFYQRQINVQLYNMAEGNFIRRLDRFLMTGEFTNATKFSEKYFIHMAAYELYLKINNVQANWIAKSYRSFIRSKDYSPEYAKIFYYLYRANTVNPFLRNDWEVPDEFVCMCDTIWSSDMQHQEESGDDEIFEDVEETSIKDRLTNMGKSIFSALASPYYAIKAGVNSEEVMNKIKNDFLLDLGLLATNFNLTTFIWAFLKLINSIFHLPDLYETFYNLFKDSYNYIKNLCFNSTQQSLGEEVEGTSVIESEESIARAEETMLIQSNFTEGYFRSFFSSFKQSAPAFCAVTATILVIITGVCMGVNVTGEQALKNRSKARRLCESFSVVSKTGVSIQNLIKLLMMWPKKIYDIAFEYILGEDKNEIAELLLDIGIEPMDEETKKEDMMEYLSYSINPINVQAIAASRIKRNRVLWLNNVFYQAVYKVSIKSNEYLPSTFSWLRDRLVDIRKTILALCKQPSANQIRFVPFWLNILGDPGTFKTTLAPIILRSLKEVLKKWEDHKDEINDDNWLYSMNFCSKHMTGYRDHYCVLIDDLFQDNVIVGDATPSDLLLIQMVSSQNFQTIQASLEDKGIEFTSKIILTTSNVYNISARKNVSDSRAITRRMNIKLKIEIADEKEPIDEDLKRLNFPKNLVFKILEKDSEVMLHKFNFEGFMHYFIHEYGKWYLLQNKLLEDSNHQAFDVNKLITSLETGGNLYELPRRSYSGLVSMNDFNNYYINPSTFKFSKKEANEPVEKTAGKSWYCTMFGQGRIKTIEHRVRDSEGNFQNIKLEQFDCVCEDCRGLNQAFEYHRKTNFDTTSDILTINQFVSMRTTNFIEDEQTSRLKTLFGKAKEVLNQIKNGIVNNWLYILVGIVSLGVAVYAVRDNTHIHCHGTGVAYSSGNTTKQIPKNIKIKPLVPIKFEPTKATLEEDHKDNPDIRLAIPDQNTYELVYNKILNKEAMCVLKNPNNNNNVECNSAIRVIEKFILSNHHFFKNLKEGEEFEVHLLNKSIGRTVKKMIFNASRYRKLGDIDAGVYMCNNTLPDASSILNHFSTKEVPDMEHQAVMVTIYDPKLFMTPVLVPGVKARPMRQAIVYDKEDRFSTLDTYSTNAVVHQGQSGSLLISTESRCRNKILGILACRTLHSNTGYFKPISQEALKDAINQLRNHFGRTNECVEDTITEDVQITGAILNYEPMKTDLLHQNLNYIARIPLDKQIAQPLKSQFKKSLIYNDQEDSGYEPAVLSSKDTRLDEKLRGKEIVFRSMAGYDGLVGAVDCDVLDIVVKELAIHYENFPNPPGLKKILLNDHQVVNGVKPYLKKVDMKTSPGMPWVKEKCDLISPGKFEFFDFVKNTPEEGNVYKMGPTMNIRYNKRLLMLKEGKKVSTVAYACLKDEIRSSEKIKQGKTRVFTCLPIDYNLAIRKYFGAFIIFQHFNAGNISSCVGVDPAKDWYRLYRKLLEKNDRWEDFDYTNWDQYLHPELIMRVADLVSLWYGDELGNENANARRVLMHDLVHTTIMVRGNLYIKSTGQCSGCSITAELNCIVHDILMYYVFILICRDKGMECSFNIYKNNVACIMYGDDIVKSVTPEYQKVFNGENIRIYMEKIGMIITPGDKISKTFELKKPEDILFLKRSFTQDPGSLLRKEALDDANMRAPLKLDVVLNIYKWIRSGEEPHIATSINCETALRELFMYGKEEFEMYQKEIYSKIRKYNEETNGHVIKLPVITYEKLARDFDAGNYELVGIEH